MYVLIWVSLFLLFLLWVLIRSFFSGWDADLSIEYYRSIQKIPGPKGVFLLGQGWDLLKIQYEDIMIWMEDQFKDFDKLMRIWTLGLAHVVIKDPNCVQTVFNNKDHISKGREYIQTRLWLNEGLLTSSGDKWHRRRKILTPAFHFKILEDNMVIFNKCAKKLTDKFQDSKGQSVKIENFITVSTLEVIMEAAMGITLDVESENGRQYLNKIRTVSEIIIKRAVDPLMFHPYIFVLSSIGREFKRSVEYLHKFTNDVISMKKSTIEVTSEEETSGKKLKAFLDRILDYERNNPGSFNDSGIREEVDTFMFEGHDTTSSALIFILFNLAKYQDIQQKVYEELKGIFDDSDRDATTNDLQKMVYMEMVIKECLRLYPSVPLISRLTDKDLILSDNITVPARTNVIVPIYLIHRNEKFWPEPDIFDPERFSDDQSQGRHSYSFIPFSAGPRNCIGQKFAMMELKTVVSCVIRRLKVLPVTKIEEIKLLPILILKSSVPIQCKFVKR